MVSERCICHTRVELRARPLYICLHVCLIQGEADPSVAVGSAGRQSAHAARMRCDGSWQTLFQETGRVVNTAARTWLDVAATIPHQLLGC